LEYGVIGFVLFFGIIFWALFLSGKQIASPRALEREHALLIPVGVALLNFVVIKGVFAQQDNQPLIFMLLGMLAALLWRIKVEPQEKPFSARGKIPTTQD
jgi:O-antigen ligase